jgi:peptide/nickel transport system ATP-binding protein
MQPPLLELRDVSKRFQPAPDFTARLTQWVGVKTGERVVRAVDHVSLEIGTAEVVGLVGESGCGKSTLGRIAAGLLPASEGQRLWKGEEIAGGLAWSRTSVQALGTVPLKNARQMPAGLAIQMIFQNPFASLNPRMRVVDLVGEAPLAHKIIDRKERDRYVAGQLERVGLDAALATRYPHQFSGGQRARIGIARALAVRPELLVCDEAVAALDVSIQAQVINLFMRLRDELGLSYLFISHDIGVVRHVSDRVIVMYLGRVIEAASADELFARPNHPYTRALLAEAPSLDVEKKKFIAVKGEIPSPLHPPSGCHFHPRCPYAHTVPGGRCKAEIPLLKEAAPGHWSACHLNDYS